MTAFNSVLDILVVPSNWSFDWGDHKGGVTISWKSLVCKGKQRWDFGGKILQKPPACEERDIVPLQSVIVFDGGGLTIGSCWQSGVTFDRKPAGTRLHVTQPSNPRSPFDLSAHVPHALPQPQDFFPLSGALTNWPWIYISAAHILVSKLFQVKAEEGGVVDRPTQLIFVWLFYLLYICQHTKKEGEGGRTYSMKQLP